MPDIFKDLEAVGKDSISDLFDFVTAWDETTKENGDVVDQIISQRMGLEVGLAIHIYSQWKELTCQKLKN